VTLSDGTSDVIFGTPQAVVAGTLYAIVITPQTGVSAAWLG
jgi:hypothetical protein